MIMKTSVLLSWEMPDNYNSPTPYKVWPLSRAVREGSAWEQGSVREGSAFTGMVLS